MTPAVDNINGQAIVLHVDHKDKRDPSQWKGFKFGVPFEYSLHNFLLRYYVAAFGIDPDKDIQIRVVPPPEMVANLRAGNLDGYLSPDPFNQRAVWEKVGFIHTLTKDIWEGHPCCDVDGAILLADRILLMTNGPHASIAEPVNIDIPRLRDRSSIVHDQRYYPIRNHLVDFLVRRSKELTDKKIVGNAQPKAESTGRIFPPEVFPSLETEESATEQPQPSPAGVQETAQIEIS